MLNYKKIIDIDTKKYHFRISYSGLRRFNQLSFSKSNGIYKSYFLWVSFFNITFEILNE